MLTILGAKVSFETLAFFILFLASEYLGASSKFRSNGVVQAILSVAGYLKLVRKEDDKIQRIKDVFRG